MKSGIIKAKFKAGDKLVHKGDRKGTVLEIKDLIEDPFTNDSYIVSGKDKILKEFKLSFSKEYLENNFMIKEKETNKMKSIIKFQFKIGDYVKEKVPTYLPKNFIGEIAFIIREKNSESYIVEYLDKRGIDRQEVFAITYLHDHWIKVKENKSMNESKPKFKKSGLSGFIECGEKKSIDEILKNPQIGDIGDLVREIEKLKEENKNLKVINKNQEKLLHCWDNRAKRAIAEIKDIESDKRLIPYERK